MIAELSVSCYTSVSACQRRVADTGMVWVGRGGEGECEGRTRVVGRAGQGPRQTSAIRRPLPYADLCPTQTSALRRPLPYADLCPMQTWYRERRRKRVRRETNMRCVYIHVQYVVYMNMMYKYIYVYIRWVEKGGEGSRCIYSQSARL